MGAASRSILKAAVITVVVISLCCASNCLGQGDQGSPAIPGDLNTDESPVTSAESLADELQESPHYPEIIPVHTLTEDGVTRNFRFRFKTKDYTIRVPVNSSVYYAAKNADKSVRETIAWNETDYQIRYYSAFINDPAQDELYENLLKELRHIKRTEILNEGEYLELLVIFVQQIAYDGDAPVFPRFPVEVIYDTTGDCDEKSLLLLGLMEREGYDVALLLFPPSGSGPGHAAAGVRVSAGTTPSFPVYISEDHRTYVFIETTALAYISECPASYRTKTAVVIPLGNGTHHYTYINYVSHITQSREKIRERLIFMADEWDRLVEEIRALEVKLSDPTRHYTEQAEYDRDYTTYLHRISRYHFIVEQYNKHLEVLEYIETHQYNVEGVYRRIENSNVLDTPI